MRSRLVIVPLLSFAVAIATFANAYAEAVRTIRGFLNAQLTEDTIA
mgnify:CR=1 FL=1